jgi:hypothetical protein
MSDIPHLTKRRWDCLRALKASKVLQRREFLAGELMVAGRSGHLKPASGATLYSLCEAGWVAPVVYGGHGEGMPFRTGGAVRAWRLTPAGLKAIEACPDTFPGEPVYSSKPDPVPHDRRSPLEHERG